MDRLLLGLPDLRDRRRPDRLPIVSRFRLQSQPFVDARVVLVGDDVPRPRSASRSRRLSHGACRPRLARRRPDAGGADHARRRHSDHLHVWRDRRPKGVVIRHRNVLANIVPVEREVIEVPHVRAAVSPAPFRQPAAAQPHVRPVDGDQRAADGPRDRDLHAQLQPARHHPPDQLAAGVGAGCVPKILDVLREHVTRAFPESPEPPPPGTSIPGAGGATGASTRRSA